MHSYLRSLLLACLLLVGRTTVSGQIVKTIPVLPTLEDTITVLFDASQGNQALKGYSGPVYLHTGLIIGTPDQPSGWRYVQGEWGKDDPRMRMRRIAPDLYQIRFHIRSFYGVPSGEPLLQLSFVFRNQNGSIVAKEIGEADIYYPQIERFEHGPIEKANASDAAFAGRLQGVQTFADGSVLLTAGEQAILLRSFGERTMQMAFFPHGYTALPVSEAVIATPQLIDTDFDPYGTEPFDIPCNEQFRLRVEREPLRLSLWQNDRLIWGQEKGLFLDQSDANIGPVVGMRTELAVDERLFGGGSRALPLNRRGQRLYTYNTASYGYTLGEEDLNISIPLVLSSAGYGLFFDSYRNGYLDLGQSQTDVLECGFKDSVLSCYLIFDDQLSGIVQEFSRLCGRQPLPPRWALGYIQSRYGYESEAQTREIVQQTRKAGFPLDAVMLDLYWFGGKKRMGDLDWDRQQFPEPERMMADFSEQGVKTILITESYFVQGTRHYAELDQKGLFARNSQGQSFLIPDFWAGPASLLDLTKAEAGQWLWPHYQRLVDQGVAGWWSDSGEPENHPLGMRHQLGTAEAIHNVYGSYWSRSLYEQQQYNNANQRFFNLCRSGYAGMQRYATFPWSGDVSRSWDAFRAQPLIMLGAGLNGIGYMHADLGGFTGGPKDPELYRRWLQMGAFVPIMRVHGDATGIEPEPIFFDEFTRSVARHYIRLRYRLLPYNYTLAWHNSLRGEPLARPLWYHYPQDASVQGVDDCYLWGRDLLVAPVFAKDQISMERYLPGEGWYDFHTDEYFSGQTAYTLHLLQENLPLFVRAGAFLPMYDDSLSHSEEVDGQHFDIHYYLSEQASDGQLFWDDGASTETVRNGEYQLLQFKAKPEAKKLHITLSELHHQPGQSAQTLDLVLHGFSFPPKKLKLNGKKLTFYPQASGERPGAYWDEQKQLLYVRFPFSGESVQLDLKR